MRASNTSATIKSGPSTKNKTSPRKSLPTSTSELTEAQADRINKEAVYQLAQAGNYDAIPAVRESPVIQDILKQPERSERAIYRCSESVRAEISQGGPARGAAQGSRPAHRAREKKNIANQIEAEYRGSRQREVLLQQALDQQKDETSAMADKMVQYNILKREAEANKQLYDGLLQKLKEAGISAGLRSSNIRVVDPALVPTAPSRPQKSRNIMSGDPGWAGRRDRARVCCASIMDNTVKNPDDVEALSPPAFAGRGAGIRDGLMGMAAAACRSSYSGPMANGTREWRRLFAFAAAIADF